LLERSIPGRPLQETTPSANPTGSIPLDKNLDKTWKTSAESIPPWPILRLPIRIPTPEKKGSRQDKPSPLGRKTAGLSFRR